MPLIGVVDPRGKESLPDPDIKVPWYTREELLRALSQDALGESHWTYEMAAAAFDNVQDRGEMLSTTAIIGSCPRSEVLKRREEYIGDLNELWSALRGTLMHRTLELYTPPQSIAEVRFFCTIDGQEISGQPDLLTQRSLIDYKVPADQSSIPMTYLYKSQTEQLMLNAFICRHAERWEPEGDLPFDPRGQKLDSVGIVFIGPKRPKVIVYKRSEDFTGPSGKKRKIRVPYVWDDKEVLDVLRPRMHMLRNALASYPDWPEPWTDPETWQEYSAEYLWGGEPGWDCPGWPHCKFSTCLAKRRRNLKWAR